MSKEKEIIFKEAKSYAEFSELMIKNIRDQQFDTSGYLYIVFRDQKTAKLDPLGEYLTIVTEGNVPSFILRQLELGNRVLVHYACSLTRNEYEKYLSLMEKDCLNKLRK